MGFEFKGLGANGETGGEGGGVSSLLIKLLIST